MEIKKLGEFGLIDIIKTDTIMNQDGVLVGIGDDAAALVPTIGQLQLLTTDMLVESVHFDLKTITPRQLGYKAVAVNISDIAAMGGIPRHVVISLALPQHIPVEFVVELYQGMKEICREFQVNIVGGDTVSTPNGMVINVAILGEVEPSCLVRRSGAKPGDLVAVTGVLGSSAAGLDLLSNTNWQELSFAGPLVSAHLTPKPQVQAGRILAPFAHSMNDVSDGLASEANEIARASGVGIRIYSEKVPLATELRQAAEFFGKRPLDYALYGGEDYQLILTISTSDYERIVREKTIELLTVVGEVVDGTDVKLITNGNAQVLAARGYNHFK